jgi:UDP-N-acetylglucosamine--N-acetylmuramyl-(pentapeptide) pyrophosphoryl-undecaprenol N-acetylglucosamine transferase
VKLFAVGGGSGGHVTPARAVIDALSEEQPDLEVRFFCDRAFYDQSVEILATAKVPVRVSKLVAGKFRRYRHLTFWQHLRLPRVVFGNIIDVFKIGIGFLQSVGILLFDRPDVVFAKGGFVSLPLGYAARLLHIPLVIHDSDTRPGLTNRLLAKFAIAIGTGAPIENYPYDPARTTYVGVPIDARYQPIDATTRAAYKRELGFADDRLLVVASGGSLGSKFINQAVVSSEALLRSHGLNTFLLTGKDKYDAIVEKVTSDEHFRIEPAVYTDFYKVLAAADIAVSRASATFLQQFAALATPVIAVPARQLGDQQQNAVVYEKHQAVVVLQDEYLADQLGKEILRLATDVKMRKQLSRNIHEFYKPHAAADMAKLIIGAVGKG